MTVKCPIIQRLPCAIHPDRVAALCHKCYELAERQRDLQWTKERKEAHKAYVASTQAAGR